jgi:hypothetical protein
MLGSDKANPIGSVPRASSHKKKHSTQDAKGDRVQIKIKPQEIMKDITFAPSKTLNFGLDETQTFSTHVPKPPLLQNIRHKKTQGRPNGLCKIKPKIMKDSSHLAF